MCERVIFAMTHFPVVLLPDVAQQQEDSSPVTLCDSTVCFCMCKSCLVTHGLA